MTEARHHQTETVAPRPNRPAYWTDARLRRAASALWGRVAVLRADIARELRKHDDERFGLIAANVADSAELSIADVIGDVYLAEIERDVGELREVENALKRINTGTYGICIDCAQAVDPMRLELSPQAARCLPCQENAEHARQPAPRSTRL
jgi:RNA polymerase-binding transcription factor DksA